MDSWGPDEWAVIWQSAPAHVLEGSGGCGRTVTAAAGAGSTDAASGMGVPAGGAEWRSAPDPGTSRRPPDGRPPLVRPRRRRPRLTRRTAGIPDPAPAEGNSDGEGNVDLQQLETRIRGMAADLAASMCEWLHLIEEFDRENGWAGVGLNSCAAWLSWTCSVAPGTAREYVRVARALPVLPLIDEAFAAGRLSYSKVRVLIQVAAEVDEAVLLQQAQVQTVSQLERTVRAFRRGDGWSQQRKRRAVWRWDEDGMLVVSARLPSDEGALLIAALERAGDDIAPRPEQTCGDVSPEDGRPGGDGGSAGGESSAGATVSDGSAGGEMSRVWAGDSGGDGAGGARPVRSGPAMPETTESDRRRAALTGTDALGLVGADMLVALARRALAAGDVDSSGDDRHLLVLHADIDQLIGDEDVETGTSAAGEPAGERSEEPAGGRAEEPAGGRADEPAHGTEHGSVPRAGEPSAGRHSWRRTAARPSLPGPRRHLEDGPGLDRRTAQRIACDAAVVAVLHNVGEGEPLRLGRKTRAISPAQRRALRIRDGGCRLPGCHRRKYLEAHHVQHWSLLGPTDLENLVLLCPYHHMLMHEGGFRVAPGVDGGWDFRDHHGALIPVAPLLPGADRDGTPPVAAADPYGLLPGWAGEPFHLAETVAVLADNPRPDAGRPGSDRDGDHP